MARRDSIALVGRTSQESFHCAKSGNIIKWYGTNVDIEDRKRADEELRRSETFLAQALNVSSTGSFSWRVETDEIK
jgi:PAS domain-containing protein